MKSQSNSQEPMKINTLLWYYFQNGLTAEAVEEAKKDLLELALSCNLKKVKVPEGDNAWDIRIGKYTTEDRQHEIIYATATNAAIDTIEQNILEAFS